MDRRTKLFVCSCAYVCAFVNEKFGERKQNESGRFWWGESQDRQKERGGTSGCIKQRALTQTACQSALQLKQKFPEMRGYILYSTYCLTCDILYFTAAKAHQLTGSLSLLSLINPKNAFHIYLSIYRQALQFMLLRNSWSSCLSYSAGVIGA